MAANLVRDPWLPVLAADGSRALVRPHEIVSGPSGPWISFDTGRPELDLACAEFVIGLLAVAAPPGEDRSFTDWFRTPPSSEELRELFSAVEEAFDVDGDGPLFMQDRALRDVGEIRPIHELLVGSYAGGQFFEPLALTWGEDRPLRVSRHFAGLLLHGHQITATSGGRGYRTSPRGGGPLTTLLVPYEPDPDTGSIPSPLWQRLWINVPSVDLDTPQAEGLDWFYPWLRRDIDLSQPVVPGPGVDPLQVFTPMPRRVLVEWRPNVDRQPCDFTGVVDDFLAIGYRRQSYGLDYPSNVWSHPLSPRYKAKPTDTATLPVRPKPGHDTLGDWIGVTLSKADGSATVAPIVDRWVKSRSNAVPEVRLQVAGFATDNAKVLDWIDRVVPVIRSVDPDAERAIRKAAEAMADSVFLVGLALKDAVKGATFSDRQDGVKNKTLLSGVPLRLTRGVRQEFYERLGVVASDPCSVEGHMRGWLAVLATTARGILDDMRPIQDAPAKDLDRWLRHRRFLGAALNGSSPAGAKIFQTLGLPKPDRKKEGTADAAKTVRGGKKAPAEGQASAMGA